VDVHTDAVQAFLSEEVTIAATGADLVSLASHKVGGPKGVGVLYVRDGIELEPVLHGGGQELGRRSGTQNVAGIVGMVRAMELSVADREGFRSRVGEARDRFEEALLSVHPDIRVTGARAGRLPQHAHLHIPGVSSETLLIRLDAARLAASAGSACHSGAIEISHVLEAMGFTPAEAGECVRFSFGWNQHPETGDEAADRVLAVLEELR
ncbi:MAG: cysteine desulfurase family protein, partial [Acidimicrobiia bacterium]